MNIKINYTNKNYLFIESNNNNLVKKKRRRRLSIKIIYIVDESI